MRRNESFVNTGLVLFNDGHCRGQYTARGTIVHFKIDDRRVRVILSHPEQVLNLSRAEAIDALVRITDNSYTPPFLGQKLHELVLYVIRILVFVNEHGLYGRNTFGVLLEQFHASH